MLTEKILDAVRMTVEEDWDRVLENTVDFIVDGTTTVGLPLWTIMDVKLEEGARDKHLSEFKPELDIEIAKSTRGMYFKLDDLHRVFSEQPPKPVDIIIWGFTAESRFSRKNRWIIGKIHCEPRCIERSKGRKSESIWDFNPKIVTIKRLVSHTAICSACALTPLQLLADIIKRLADHEDKLEGELKVARERNAELHAVIRAIEAHR